MSKVIDTLTGFSSFFFSRWRKNRPGFVRALAPWLLVVVIAAAADFLTTWRFMAEGSPEDELHPVIRFVSRHLGTFWGPLAGKIGQLAAIFFLAVVFRPAARAGLVIIALIYLYAAWYNAWGHKHYIPRFLDWLSASLPA